MGFFDLEEQFAFYGAYHRNPINIFIHTLFVWPILFTALILFYFVPFNFGLFFAAVYALFYAYWDKKAGSVAAILCFLCWLAACSIAARLGFSLAWKVIYSPEKLYCSYSEEASAVLYGNSLFVLSCPAHAVSMQVTLAAQLFCWTAQFVGHGVFEKRAPALLDNLAQAFLMAPFFVLLEVLDSFFGYEPYPGFHASVKAKIDANVKEWQESKQKKVS